MKKIQRLTDNQYLVDLLKDLWTENIEEAKAFRKGEAFVTRLKLMAKGLKPEEIKEIEL